jgi:CheY-like chemotaxis protein
VREQRKILVVEDNPVSHRALAKILENSHFIVISAWTAAEAFDLTIREKPDAICMDVILPDKDGISVVRDMKANPSTREIPVIFVTNKVSLKDDKGHEFFEIDGVAHRAFAKPFHAAKIISVLQKEINRRRSGGSLPKKMMDLLSGTDTAA